MNASFEGTTPSPEARGEEMDDLVAQLEASKRNHRILRRKLAMAERQADELQCDFASSTTTVSTLHLPRSADAVAHAWKLRGWALAAHTRLLGDERSLAKSVFISIS